MVEFSLVWHAGHLMEAGDAAVVCWTEEPSISDSSSVIYCPQPQTCSLFLSLTIFSMLVGLQGQTAPLHILHLLLRVRIWPKTLPFLVSFCLLQNYSLPTPSNVTSLPKWDLPKEGPAAVSLVSLQDPSSAGEWTVCIYVPRSDNIQNCTFLFCLSALHWQINSSPNKELSKSG